MFAPWLVLLLITYQAGLCGLATVPLSGHGAPWAPVLTGDIPAPSAALTVHRVTPAGVSPTPFMSAHRACSSTVVPEAVAAPPRETNVAVPATPLAATSAIAWAMLCASGVGPGRVGGRAGEDEVVGEDRVPVLVLVGEPVGDELVLQRRRRGRSARSGRRCHSRRSGWRCRWPSPMYLKANCGNAAWNCGLDQVGHQAGVADVAGADDRQRRRAVGARERRGQHHDERRPRGRGRGSGQQPAQAGAGGKIGGKRAPTWGYGMGH